MLKEIDKALQLLNQGEVVAIPTETVYGLAANAFNEKAVKKVFEIKQRPLFNPLIVHIKSIDYLEQIAKDIPIKALELANHFWPGALTLVLPKKNIIPSIVTANKDTVAIRVPSHPMTLQLLNRLDFPLAAPSANPFGYISPTKAIHIEKQLGNKIPYILDGGNCEKGIESTIIGFENDDPILYRVGAISKEEIEKYIGKIEIKNKATEAPEAPGMLGKHYSPKTKLIISNTITASINEHKNNNVGFLLFSDNTMLKKEKFISLSQNNDLEEATQNLYAAMHELDAMEFDFIIAETFPNTDLGVSINDRLFRAQKN